MTATLFIVLLIVGIFIVDLVKRWWKENEWKRRWREEREKRD